MSFLSKIDLNPLRRGAQKIIQNPQAMHAAILGGIPNQPVAERVLWRLELENHACYLYVLTKSSPSWEHLIEQAGWATSNQPQYIVKNYSNFLNNLNEGDNFSFRLRANPVSSSKTPLKSPEYTELRKNLSSSGGRVRGKRMAHRTTNHQLSWITNHERLERWGMEIPMLTASQSVSLNVIIQERKRYQFQRTANQTKNIVTIQTVTYKGLLKITDLERFKQTLLNGVGSAKSYGCGLITLAQIPNSQI